MIIRTLTILCLLACTAMAQTTRPATQPTTAPATRPGVEYNAHQRPDPADPRPRLPVIYEQDIWDPALPRDKRDALDHNRLRVALRLVARSSDIVVLDIEAPAWSDARFFDRWSEVTRFVKAEQPQLRLAAYNIPYGDFLRNIRANNDWHRNWVWSVYRHATSEAWRHLDYACLALYPQPEDKTLDDFKARAEGNLRLIRLAGKPVIIFLHESDDMPAWMPEAARWLTEQGIDVAWWRSEGDR